MGTKRPGRPYGWVIVALCVAAQIGALGLTFNTYSLFLPMWTRDLHAPVSTLQLPLAGLLLVGAMTAPVIGAWADKYPARRLVAIGVAGMALACLGVSMVTAAWQIVAIFGLVVAPAMGLCAAIVANAVISRWFDTNRGLALGINSFGQNLAGVVLPPLVAPALLGIGWRAIWELGAGVLALAILPAVRVWLREPGRAATGGGPPGHGGGGLSAGAVLRRPNFWLIIAAYLPLLAALNGVMQNLGPYAASKGLTPADGGALLSLVSASGMAGMLAAGMLVDRIGVKLPFAGFGVATALGAVLLAAGSSTTMIYAGAALVGLSAAAATLLATALSIEFGPDGCGRALGMAMAMIPVSAPAAFLIARAQEASGSYAPGLLGLAGLAIAGGAMILLTRPPAADTMALAMPAE